MKAILCLLFHRHRWVLSQYYGRRWYVCYACLRTWGRWVPKPGGSSK